MCAVCVEWVQCVCGVYVVVYRCIQPCVCYVCVPCLWHVRVSVRRVFVCIFKCVMCVLCVWCALPCGMCGMSMCVHVRMCASVCGLVLCGVVWHGVVRWCVSGVCACEAVCVVWVCVGV